MNFKKKVDNVIAILHQNSDVMKQLKTIAEQTKKDTIVQSMQEINKIYQNKIISAFSKTLAEVGNVIKTLPDSSLKNHPS